MKTTEVISLSKWHKPEVVNTAQLEHACQITDESLIIGRKFKKLSNISRVRNKRAVQFSAQVKIENEKIPFVEK